MFLQSFDILIITCIPCSFLLNSDLFFTPIFVTMHYILFLLSQSCHSEDHNDKEQEMQSFEVSYGALTFKKDLMQLYLTLKFSLNCCHCGDNNMNYY